MYWSKMTYYVAENRCSCGLAAENNIKMLPRTHAMARRSLTWHCLKMGSGGLFYLLTLNLEPRTCIWQTHRLSIVKNRGHFLSCLLKRFLTFFKFDFLFKGSGYSSRSRSGRDKYGPPVRTEYRLIVENLSSRCSWQDLKVHVCSWIIRLLYSFYPQLFLENYVMVFFFVFFSIFFVLQDFMRQAGEVTYADAHKERTNEGVIEFRSYSDMKRALDKLDGTDINGRKIRLVEDRPRRRRSYSGSRSR